MMIIRNAAELEDLLLYYTNRARQMAIDAFQYSHFYQSESYIGNRRMALSIDGFFGRIILFGGDRPEEIVEQFEIVAA